MGLKVGIAGMGGFAQAHHRAIWELERAGEVRLVATCDPAQASFTDNFELGKRGVVRYESLEAMVAAEALDVVTLPTPIPLHAAQHALLVRNGIAVYLEKPPTLWRPEYQQMMELERQARFATAIGFNFVGDPMRRGLKQRLLGGGLGEMRSVAMLALWPRDAAYYGRNDWAGRQTVEGRPVMDSPIGNAVAHFVQDLLFWCGQGSVDAVAPIGEVSAERWRAHPIENFDTVLAAGTLGEGFPFRIAATHTGSGPSMDREIIRCAEADIVFKSWNTSIVRHRDGRVESLESTLDYGGILRSNLQRYFAFVAGWGDRPFTTLADSAPFVDLLARIRESGEIQEFPEELKHRENGYVSVNGLRERLLAFIEGGDVGGSES